MSHRIFTQYYSPSAVAIVCLVTAFSFEWMLATAQTFTSSIPPEVAEVYIGMEWKQFVASHKNAEALSMGPNFPSSGLEPEAPRDAATERIHGNELFNRVIYGFEDGQITSVMFTGELQANIPELREQFLVNVLSEYGKPNYIGLLSVESGDGIATWERPDSHFAATLPIVIRPNSSVAVAFQVLSPDLSKRIAELRILSKPKAPDPGVAEDEDRLVRAFSDEIDGILASMDFKADNPRPTLRPMTRGVSASEEIGNIAGSDVALPIMTPDGQAECATSSSPMGQARALVIALGLGIGLLLVLWRLQR